VRMLAPEKVGPFKAVSQHQTLVIEDISSAGLRPSASTSHAVTPYHH